MFVLSRFRGLYNELMCLRESICVKRLALAAALVLTIGARASMGQRVVVRSSPPGSKVELATSAGTVASGTADGYGDATLSLPAREGDVRIFVDTCGTAVRVVFLIPGESLAAEAGCTRKELWGIYQQRPITTFVVEMNGAEAAVYVAQGPPPPGWIQRGEEAEKKSRIPWGKPSRGLMVSGGAGLSSFGRALKVACGDLACNSSNIGGALTAGAEYWMTNIVAAYAAYVRPADVTATGTGTGFHFDSQQRTRLLIVGGKVGRGVGPARLYAMAGMNRHEATFNTTQTNDSKTVTVDGVVQTLPGGTQSFGQQTRGWNWTLGGGVEAWVAGRLAVYGEYSRAKLKAPPVAGGEGGIDDQVTHVVIGLRLRLLP